MKRLTIYEIKEMLSNINKNIKILDNVYINNHTKLKCKCLIDNHEWETAWNNIKAGRGCPKCAISLIKNKIYQCNSIRDIMQVLNEFLGGKSNE